jgi:hypothetical protein
VENIEDSKDALKIWKSSSSRMNFKIKNEKGDSLLVENPDKKSCLLFNLTPLEKIVDAKSP